MAEGKTGLGGLQLTYRQNGSRSLAPPLSAAAHRCLTPRGGGAKNGKNFKLMPSFRTALLATAATALSLAATPAALAGPLSFTNYTTTNGLGSDFVFGVYASGSNIYAATYGGLSISTNGGSSFTNYTTTSGLGSDTIYGVYASGSTIYAATDGGLSIAQQSDPTPSAVPGPLPLFGAASAFGFSRKLRRRLRAAASSSPIC